MVILPTFEPVLASFATVRDERAGALVSTVSEDGGPAAGAVDAGLGERSSQIEISYDDGGAVTVTVTDTRRIVTTGARIRVLILTTFDLDAYAHHLPTKQSW